MGDDRINVYMPRNTTVESTARWAVLYLCSTTSEAPPMDRFHADTTIYAPQVTNKHKKPWKTPIPKWLIDFIANEQRNDGDCRWSLFGFSLGAAWGALLAAEFVFAYVVLVAPFLVNEGDSRKLMQKLPAYSDQLIIVVGSEDAWSADRSKETFYFRQVVERSCPKCQCFDIDGIGHEGSLDHAVQKLNLCARLSDV